MKLHRAVFQIYNDAHALLLSEDPTKAALDKMKGELRRTADTVATELQKIKVSHKSSVAHAFYCRARVTLSRASHTVAHVSHCRACVTLSRMCLTPKVLPVQLLWPLH